MMQALTHLSNLALDGQELLLKCNAATQKYIDEYKVLSMPHLSQELDPSGVMSGSNKRCLRERTSDMGGWSSANQSAPSALRYLVHMCMFTAAPVAAAVVLRDLSSQV